MKKLDKQRIAHAAAHTYLNLERQLKADKIDRAEIERLAKFLRDAEKAFLEAWHKEATR